MKNGMKRTLAALALCAAVVAGAFADAKSDALLRATDENNVAEALRLIKAGADVNARGYAGSTALMYAAASNAAEIADALIKAGADVNANTGYADIAGLRAGEEKTALMFAAENNSSDVTRLLIAA